MTFLITIFAFSSVLGNYSYAEVNLFFLGANKLVVNLFRIVVLLSVGIGAIAALAAVWAIADVAMALMAIVNLIAITLLGKWAFGAFTDYQRQEAAGSGPDLRRGWQHRPPRAAARRRVERGKRPHLRRRPGPQLASLSTDYTSPKAGRTPCQSDPAPRRHAEGSLPNAAG